MAKSICSSLITCPHASSGLQESNVSIYSVVVLTSQQGEALTCECIEFSQQEYVPKEAEAGVQSTTHVEDL